MKIVIVGAGPVGCYTAQLLKKMGYQPVVLEEHLTVGKPVECAGIISSKLLDLMQPFLSEETVINKINGFSINSSWVESFSINIPGIAVMVNREKFDFDLGEGLEIHLGQRVSSIKRESGFYLVETVKGSKFEADILIGADGVNSMVRKYLVDKYAQKNGPQNIKNIKLDYYFGLQYQINLTNSEQVTANIYGNTNANDVIQVYFNGTVPFFIWIAPENHQKLRVGVIAEEGKKVLTNFIKEKGIDGKIEEVVTGKISVGFIPTYCNQIALVGDAACQVKPLTGGGLFYGLQSARLLADCIAEGHLEQYDNKWKKMFGPEIKFGIKGRKIYESLDEQKRGELFQLFRKNAHFIEQMVDYDHHSLLFREALRRPQLLMDAGKLFRFYLEDLVKEFFA
jgi:flavin-dependent dehydrogenase